MFAEPAPGPAWHKRSAVEALTVLESALVRVFHRAGIRTLMITGDQSATAEAVARSLDLAEGEPLALLEATRLEQLEPMLLKGLAQRVHVFSAVSPSRKLQIVQALQGAGFVVAMTGDGINDGPALKAADIGVAMGNSGSQVAGMVSDVILEDDNLQTMIVAIRQGRSIYGNTRQAIHYLLASNMSEIIVMLTAIAAGAGTPLTPLQLLWINLVSDIFPVRALATQQPNADLMDQPPRDPREHFLGRRDLAQLGVRTAAMSAGTLAAYAWAASRYGIGPQASSVAFMTLTLGEILHMLSARSSRPTLFGRHAKPLDRAFA